MIDSFDMVIFANLYSFPITQKKIYGHLEQSLLVNIIFYLTMRNIKYIYLVITI